MYTEIALQSPDRTITNCYVIMANYDIVIFRYYIHIAIWYPDILRPHLDIMLMSYHDVNARVYSMSQCWTNILKYV